MKHANALSQDEALLQQLNQTVLDNLDNEQFGVEALCEQVCISRSHLHRKLKLLKGQSISQFIRAIRLEEAMKLLRQDVATASEIAYRVGFGSPTYFHRCFRRHYGYSPGDVKKRMEDGSETETVPVEENKTTAAGVPNWQEETQTTTLPTPLRSRKTLNKVLVLMVFSFGIFLAGYYFYPRQPALRSIAVLPLHNYTGDPEQDYFVNGFHDALIGALGQVSALRVISRTSTLRYQSHDLPSLQEIARELGVEVILEGSVAGSGDHVRIQLQLIEAFPEERHLWAQEYQQDLRNILVLQSDVVQTIAREIHVSLTPQEETLLAATHQVNPEAYKAYLKGVFYWDKLTKNDLNTAMGYFELARQLDPSYALAHAGIALVWIGRLQQGFASHLAGVTPLRTAAMKALALDSTLSEVHYTLGLSGCWVEWNYATAEKELRKAIALNPNNSAARAYLSHVLNIRHQPEESMEQIELALALDPFNPLYQALYGMNLNFSRQFDKAIDLFGNALKTDANHAVALSTLRTTYHMKGMYEEALEIWKTSYVAKQDFLAVEALERGARQGGYPNALEALARLLIDRSDTAYVTPWQIGTLFTRAGKKEEAITWLEKAYEAHDSNMPYIGVDPIFDSLRDDPRFQGLLKRMGLTLPEHPLYAL